MAHSPHIVKTKCLIPYTEGAIKNEQSRETGNIGKTKKTKQKHNTICVGHHYTQIT
jgi:hypothetical protein